MEKRSITENITVIIPSLNPDEKLRGVVSSLLALGFCDIVIVNDGSDEEHTKNFPSENDSPCLTILRHPVNRGKGAALKTAFKYVIENRPETKTVVTVDGDGQHRAQDVLACCEKSAQSGTLVLGVRDFSLSHVPARSRFGNKTTSLVFRLACGLKISDTQTGLRAIPAIHLGDLLTIEGDRFEYETNMLLNLKNLGIKMSEQTIETVYIEENKTSHFRPVRDSLKIYSLILKFIASSTVAAVLDHLLFFLVKLFFGKYFVPYSVLIPMIIARVFSSATNFALNKKTVFKNNGSILKTLVKYYVLAVPMLLISCIGIDWVSSALGITNAALVTLIKIVIESILFLLSFRLQREWVFSSKRKENK